MARVDGALGPGARRAAFAARLSKANYPWRTRLDPERTEHGIVTDATKRARQHDRRRSRTVYVLAMALVRLPRILRAIATELLLVVVLLAVGLAVHVYR